MLLQYDTVIKEQLNRGIIEVVDKPQAHTNHQVHLNSLLKRLQQNSDMLLQYDTVIKEQLIRGIIEVPQAHTNHQVYYLPHHAVIREDKKTTKLRIVYENKWPSTT